MKKIIVTKIINKYEILLNVGEVDGITASSTFEIIGRLNEVLDPITNAPLGELIYPKAKLQIKKLMPKMCICEDYSNKVENAYLMRILSNPILQNKIVRNELNLDIDDYASEQVDKAIYIGDEVLLIEEPKHEEQDTSDNNEDDACN